MASVSLMEFINKNKSFRKQLTPKQIMAVRRWARKIEFKYQKGYLECLKEYNGKRLQIYLENLVPDYLACDE